MKDPRRLCPGCMNEWAKPDQACPICGFIRSKYERAARWLPLYTVLERKIMIGKVIGEGGFGITYMGWDLNLEVRVAVKEYFPMGLATAAGSLLSVIVCLVAFRVISRTKTGLCIDRKTEC